MRFRPSLGLLAVLFLLLSGIPLAHAQKSAEAATGKEAVLKASEISTKLFPDKVFFRGQVANVQMRNAGGVRYADGLLVLAALVDNSGYSSALREKYQAYLITELSLEIGGQTLKPGAYGCGFLEGNKFVVMDIASNDLFQVGSTRDTEIRHPVPLQILATSVGGKYRFYQGRDYIELHRAK
jgi:hypothetical protein